MVVRSPLSAFFAAPLVLSSLFAAGCGQGEEPIVVDAVGQSEDPIINGTPDTTHQAVVAVVGGNNECSGTIIQKNGSTGHVITAAHCGSPQYVLQGNDYNNPDYVYPVIDFKKHPSWGGQTGDVYDFMIVRFTSAGPATPVIPAMTQAQDNLTAGTQIRHVGYGKAGPAPGSNNSIRRQILGTLSGVQPLTLSYDQPSGGPCSGDSGGPQLTMGTERVAGVVSYGDQNCAVAGVSGRVSAVYDSFIMAYINGTPIGPQTCDQCQQAAVSGQGACVNAVNACLNDASCSALVDCINGCTDNACVQTCANQHASAIGLYNAIGTCVCDVGCVDECASASFCQGGSSSSSSGSSSSSSSGSSSGSSGSGGGSTSSGAGGGPSSSGQGNADGWVAGGQANKKYQGEILMSQCSARRIGGRGSAGLWLLAGALAAIGVSRRRSSGRGARA